tara:strand:- start:3215 stop:4294 length:1080 start_codon:yes stop_codon:yes gene_type:complete
MDIIWGSEPNTMSSDSQTPQDWRLLSKYLSQHNISFDPAEFFPKQFSAGFGNLNYLIMINGSKAVLRRPPMGKIPPGANDMKREHHILSRLSSSFPLAPKSLHYCPEHHVLGNHFLIMEYREGSTIGGNLPDQLKSLPDIGVKLSNLLVDILVDLHNVDPINVDLGNFGKPEGFLSRAVAGWKKRLMFGSNNSPCVAAIEVVEWLEKNIVSDGAPTLLHNDFKLDNILLNPKTIDPVAVVDWDMGSRGDPLFDLGTLLSYWVEPGDPDSMQVINQMPTAKHGFLNRKEIIDLYQDKSGRNLDNFLFYRVLTQFKLAVVFLQIDAQFRRGSTSDERFGQYRDHLDGMFAFALDIALGNID